MTLHFLAGRLLGFAALALPGILVAAQPDPLDANAAVPAQDYRSPLQHYRAQADELLTALLPHTGKIVDDLCLIRSMQTDAVNHAPAQIMMNTGSQQFGRPSFGSWTLYGLGSESQDLPGFVVLTSAKGTSGGASNYGSGFLPTVYSGIPL